MTPTSRRGPTRRSSSRRRGGAAASPAGHDGAGRRAHARRRHRLGLRRPRHLRPLRGRRRRSATFAKHGITSAPGPPHAGRRASRRPTAPSTAWPTTGGCRARPSCSATASSTSRPRARSTARSCARTSPPGRSRSTRSSACTPSTSTPPDLATPTGDLGRLFDALRARVGPRRTCAPTSTSSGRSSRRSTAGDVPGHRRGPRRSRRHRGLARLPRPGLRRRHRRRLDDDRRPSRRPDRRRGPRQRRGDEPADPLRRGPHEPGQLRDDARGRRRRADARPCARRSTGCSPTLANRAGIKRAEILELALVGNPIMHHLLLGIDPTPLGSAPFALATDTAVDAAAPRELGLRDPPGRAGLRPAVHRRPRRRGHGRGHPRRGAARGRRDLTLVVDVGTNAEIVLGDRDRLLAASSPDRPGLRGRPDQRRPARRARAPSSASGSTATRSSRASGSSASTPGRTSPDFAEALAAAGTGVTGICGSGIIEVIAELYLAGVITADGVIDGALAGADAARRRRTAGRSATSCTSRPTAARASSSPRTTSGPSSWPRPRCTPASGCSWTSSGSRRVDEVRLAGAFGSQIDPLHAMVLGPRPRLRPRPTSGRPGTPPGPARSSRCCRGAARREIEARRPPGREDRDRGRAALPGALRRGDGHPAPDRAATRTWSAS